RLPVGRMIALQTFTKSDDERAVEKCVLAVALFCSAPTWIAPEVGIWRADYDSALVILRTLKDVTGFVTLDLSGLFQQLGIPRFSETDSLRKRRARHSQRPAPFAWATLRQTVNAFDVPAGLDAKSKHARIRVETLDLLVERHRREDVVDSLFDGKIGILEWIGTGLL